MKDLIKKFVSDERGLETVEYAIITGLIVAGTIFLISQIGSWVKGEYGNLHTELTNPQPGN